MTWIILGILLVAFLASIPVRRALAVRREQELAATEAFRINRKVIEEDVTVFGEQVAELHIDTLATELDGPMEADYRSALGYYDRAKELLAVASSTEEVAEVSSALEEGRYSRACLLARQDGLPVPRRREECYFNPQHGPAMSDVTWTPPGGVAREIAVCASDARRLAGGEPPDLRLVRVGDRYVPWYAAPHERGLLTASIGSMAIGGVPSYLRFEADLANLRNHSTGGGGGGIMP